jgi:hydrogenase maturation protease
MTATTTARHDRSGSVRARILPTRPVDVLLCGSADRGDDGAPVAARGLLRDLPTGTRVQSVGQLDIDDLLAVPSRGAVVIVDAATGIGPGTILELPLRGLLGNESAPRPRSSHALAIPELIGVADMVRGRPLTGRIVVIGARRFGIGRSLSRRVEAALPALADAIRNAVRAVAESDSADSGSVSSPRRS